MSYSKKSAGVERDTGVHNTAFSTSSDLIDVSESELRCEIVS